MTLHQVLRRVEHWRVRLLPEWRLTVHDQPLDEQDEDYHAQVRADENYRHGELYFTDECLARDEASIDVTIVHELSHLVFREMRIALDRLCTRVNSDVWQVVLAEYMHEEEQAADRVARAVVHADRGEWPAFGTMTEE